MTANILLPGVQTQDAVNTLRNMANGARNVHGGSAGRSARDMQSAYLQWTETAEYMLRPRLRPQALAEVLLTPRSLTIRSLDASSPRLIPFVLAELDTWAANMETVAQRLADLTAKWSTAHGCLAVVDTNVLLHHRHGLNDIEWPVLLRDRDGVQGVHIVLPLAVVDELDRLKHNGKSDVRTRARTTLRTIDTCLAGNPATRAVLRVDDTRLGGIETTLDLLIDEPDHVRLPSLDAEIVACASDLQQLVGRPVQIVSGDLGMRLRARAGGLGVVDPFSQAGGC